ncbi:uncharacterized protein [Littorina saxatilis]|uniref:Methyltransferase FkbM domain-containing protein n=1 Tax=Littorina saxatilis TaxID=31220 RepID=A0AAN9GK62_9CAEN
MTTCRFRFSAPTAIATIVLFTLLFFGYRGYIYPSQATYKTPDNLKTIMVAPSVNGHINAEFEMKRKLKEMNFADDKTKPAELERMGTFFTRRASDWSPMTCDRSQKLRKLTLPTGFGNLSFYVYDSANADRSVTAFALQGHIFEKDEIEKFIKVSSGLPLIDIGANVGLVSLQAAMQGRQVFSVEPIYDNAIRLCRSALDFGHAHLVHVINNAVSSFEGNVTLAMDAPKYHTRFEVVRSKGWGHEATVVYAIVLDRLLDILPFRRAALKIDVESHEGHVISGAQRLFQEMDIPLVWMEWEHVKKRKEYGGQTVLDFMQKNKMAPYDLMSGKLLTGDFMKWPFGVLWRKEE